MKERFMTSSEKLLELYNEIIVNRYIDEKDAMQEWHDRYKSFIETVQARTVELKKGKKLDYDNGDQEFLDHFFISNNPVSSRGSNPISDEDLRTILRSNDFTCLIEETMLNPNKKSWVALIEKGKNIFKRSHFDNQPLRFNRISASCTSSLIPMPSENAFNKFVKYLNDNEILDFTNIEKSWYAQNEYLTNKFHEIFNNKILDENDFTDEYWLNLFAWSLYDKKVNQSESDVKDTETKPNTGTKKMENSLNRILFGAAGTGKTFNTINHALSIIEDKSLEELEKEERRDLKNRFDEYKNKGQIKFVTFHQSFSYEDFVEGIRAETVEDNEGKKNIEYPVVSGVFKSLCDIAQSKVILESQKNNFDPSANEIWKMSLGRAGEEEDIFDYCIKNDCVLLGWGNDINFSNATNRKQVEEIMDENGYEDYRKKYPSASRFVNDFKNKTKVSDLIIISDGNHKFRAIGEISGNYELLPDSDDAPRYVQKKSVKWLKLFKPSLNVEQVFDKVLSQQTIYNLANAINITKLKNLLDSHQKEDNDKKFVLIIDEINRGNISRIFGELITLIEESKRQGAKEQLSVTLPYSKQEFTVPNNVYIIGTMNSSDRSLTGLDIALRRRFTFIEMPPKPEEIKDENGVLIEIHGQDQNGDDASVIVAELLKVMNQRIEVLLDRDHCIGHANFMSLEQQPTLDNLSKIFKQKVIPQLQEYFFDDWAKINLVLNGNGMLQSKSIEKSVIFPNVDSEELGYFEDKKAWELVPTSFDKIESFTKIIQH